MNNICLQLPLPSEVQIETSGAHFNELRLDRIYMYGGVVTVRHGVELGEDNKKGTLTALDELILGLGSVGVGMSQIAAPIYNSYYTIRAHAKAINRIFGTKGPSAPIRSTVHAYEKGIFTIEKPIVASDISTDFACTIIRQLAAGFTNAEIQIPGLSNPTPDQVKQRVSKLYATMHVNNRRACVFYGVLAGIVPIDTPALSG